MSSVVVKKYNIALRRSPILTKCITGAVLSALSELVSQWVSLSAEEKEKKLNWVKIGLMSLYGGLLNSPVNHFSYKWITNFTSRKVAVKWRAVVQLACSLGIVSPIQVFGLLCTLTSINVGKIDKKVLVNAIKSRYLPILSSSLATSTIILSIAQKFLAPEKWSVFFSLAYAILGTGQNVYLKFQK